MDTLQNYTVDYSKLLGKGSFSKVYHGVYTGCATHVLDTGTQVAVKVISMKDNINLVEDEVRLMCMIKDNPHPNIVECYAVIRTDSSVSIVMEYCDSGNLRDILKKPIKEKYAQFYFSQLINGLKYLDQHNIIHRDIKPRNILLTDKRRILKIADFGFAKRTTNDISMYDTICGSPMYMAPEIMRKQQYNKQTDMWSIGMILYEMLYGYHPYHKCKNIDELKRCIDIETVKIPPSETTNTNISSNCVDLLKLLLQKEVDRRITWLNLFNHPWVNMYETPQKEDSSVCSSESIKDTPKIIDDYIDNYSKYKDTISDNSCMFQMDS